CWFRHGGSTRGLSELFVQRLESKAEFCTFHTATPWYSFVPERVWIWTCPLPRPISASTGARISLISPTRSGFIRVGESRPLGHRWLLTLMPSRCTLTSRALTPAKFVCSAPKTASFVMNTPAITPTRSSTLLLTSGRSSTFCCGNTSPTDDDEEVIKSCAATVTSTDVATEATTI